MTATPGSAPPKTPISLVATRGDLIAMIHNRDALVSDLKEALASALLAAKPAEEGISCLLLNQIEIMGAVSLLLRYVRPDLAGNAGELARQRDDLLQRHKATQAALSTPGQKP